jgi:hypothetical protein
MTMSYNSDKREMYAGADCAETLCAGRETALDRLSEFGSAADRIGDMLQRFMDRFQGNPSQEGCDPNVREVPNGHFAQLDRLEKLLARAENLAADLRNIG